METEPLIPQPLISDGLENASLFIFLQHLLSFDQNLPYFPYFSGNLIDAQDDSSVKALHDGQVSWPLPLSILNSYILYKERTRSPVIESIQKGVCEGACQQLWYLFFPHSKRPSKEVSRRIDLFTSWEPFPRENSGHWEEEKHYLIMCCLFSCPKKDFSKNRRNQRLLRAISWNLLELKSVPFVRCFS